MTDPRHKVGYEAVDDHPTYAYDASIVADETQPFNSAQYGLAVTMTGPGTVGLAADGQAIRGKLRLVGFDGFCQVDVGGHQSFPAGSGAVLTLGSKIVGALGAGGAKGYIRTAAPATLAEVALGVGQIIDASVATSVWVDLD